MQCLFWTFTMHCRRFFPMSSHLLMVNQVSMLHWITEWLSHSYCKVSWSRCTVYMFSLNTIQNLLKKRIFILRIIHLPIIICSHECVLNFTSTSNSFAVNYWKIKISKAFTRQSDAKKTYPHFMLYCIRSSAMTSNG